MGYIINQKKIFTTPGVWWKIYIASNRNFEDLRSVSMNTLLLLSAFGRVISAAIVGSRQSPEFNINTGRSNFENTICDIGWPVQFPRQRQQRRRRVEAPLSLQECTFLVLEHTLMPRNEECTDTQTNPDARYLTARCVVVVVPVF